MRTRKIIIYPLLLAFLVPLTASAMEAVGTEAVLEGGMVQEEYHEPESVGNVESETGNVQEPDAGNTTQPENEPPAENASPEIPQGEVNTVPEIIPESTPVETSSETQVETELQTQPETQSEPTQAETESQAETQTETQTEQETQTETESETEKPILDEEVTGLLKEYLTGAVSGNDASQETVAEPVNTEYQAYIQEALQVLQDNSTTQVNLSIVILAAVAVMVGLLIGYLIMRRFI